MARFEKGKTGNKLGRPKLREEFKARAMKLVDEVVIDAWADEIELRDRAIMTPAGPMDMVCRGKDWMKATELATAYALGKPSQSVEMSGPDGGPIQHDVREISDAELAKIAAKGAK